MAQCPVSQTHRWAAMRFQMLQKQSSTVTAAGVVTNEPPGTHANLLTFLTVWKPIRLRTLDRSYLGPGCHDGTWSVQTWCVDVALGRIGGCCGVSGVETKGGGGGCTCCMTIPPTLVGGAHTAARSNSKFEVKKLGSRSCSWAGLCLTGGGAGGAGTQHCMHQKWPNKIFSVVNFVFFP